MPENTAVTEEGQQQDQQVEESDQDQSQKAEPDESVEYWKQKARDHERRNRKLTSAAKRLEEIEEAQKTEDQKRGDRMKALEDRAIKAEQDALRFRIAAKYKIADEDADLFLTGQDEETLTKQAERLQVRTQDQKRQPGWGAQEGRSPKNSGDPELAFVDELFNGAE